MPKRISTARSLLRKVFGDSPGQSKLIQEGRRQAFKDEGGGSLFMWPIIAAAKKIKGADKVNRALYNKYQRPLKNVDEKAGRILKRELGAEKLFDQVDVLPTRRRMGRGKHKALIEHRTTSATAPISKTVKALTPIAATLYTADLLNKTGGDMAEQLNPVEDKDSLLKEAADALDLAQRREEAMKLAFAMVERGKIPAFETYDDFFEKISSLMQKDLRVVEEAIDMDADMADFGKVASGPELPNDPATNFFHRLAEE